MGVVVTERALLSGSRDPRSLVLEIGSRFAHPPVAFEVLVLRRGSLGGLEGMVGNDMTDSRGDRSG
jgi:hypothetical protein